MMYLLSINPVNFKIRNETRLMITVHRYDGIMRRIVLKRGTKYTMVAPPTRLAKMRMKLMVVIIIL